MVLRKHDEIPWCIRLISFDEGTKFPGSVNEVRELIGRDNFGN
jgi:hypothetical protein